MGTLFASVYDRFLGKVTDDMYLELTPPYEGYLYCHQTNQ